MAEHGTINQFPRIEQVFRPEMLGRPPAPIVQLDAKKVSDVAKHAISDRSHQLPIAVAYGNRGAGIHGFFYLQADSGKRNVLQICHSPALAAGVVLPNYLHQFGTEEPIVDSSFVHMLLIGRPASKVSGPVPNES